MSKIGRLPVKIEQGVEVSIEKSSVLVKGLKGEIKVHTPKGITVERNEDMLVVKRKHDSKEEKSLHGLVRSLLNNAVVGVSKGFSKTLILSGVGFRSSLQDNKLILLVGYSHPVEIEQPKGITFTIVENRITVAGFDKQLVGDIASKIRKVKPPEPYKGKGIKYEDEVIRRKPGKAQAAGATQ